MIASNSWVIFADKTHLNHASIIPRFEDFFSDTPFDFTIERERKTRDYDYILTAWVRAANSILTTFYVYRFDANMLFH